MKLNKYIRLNLTWYVLTCTLEKKKRVIFRDKASYVMENVVEVFSLFYTGIRILACGALMSALKKKYQPICCEGYTFATN